MEQCDAEAACNAVTVEAASQQCVLRQCVEAPLGVGSADEERDEEWVRGVGSTCLTHASLPEERVVAFDTGTREGIEKNWNLIRLKELPDGGMQYWWEYHLEPHLVLVAFAGPPQKGGRTLHHMQVAEPQARLPVEVSASARPKSN